MDKGTCNISQPLCIDCRCISLYVKVHQPQLGCISVYVGVSASMWKCISLNWGVSASMWVFSLYVCGCISLNVGVSGSIWVHQLLCEYISLYMIVYRPLCESVSASYWVYQPPCESVSDSMGVGSTGIFVTKCFPLRNTKINIASSLWFEKGEFQWYLGRPQVRQKREREALWSISYG